MTSAIESAEITHVTSKTLFLGSPRAGKGFNRSYLSTEMHSLHLVCINKKKIEPIVTDFKAVFTSYFSTVVRNVSLLRRMKELTLYLLLTQKTEININCMTMHRSNNGTLWWGPSEFLYVNTQCNINSYIALSVCGGVIGPFVTISGEKANAQNW